MLDYQHFLPQYVIFMFHLREDRYEAMLVWLSYGGHWVIKVSSAAVLQDCIYQWYKHTY